MPTIELWEKTGKGAVKFLHNLRRPQEVVALESADGSLYPIYQEHDEVPPGIYGIVQLRPYANDDNDVFHRAMFSVECLDENEVVNIVNAGDFVGGYIPYKEKQWNKYVNKNAEKLERPIGWVASIAERMLVDVNKRK